jgi:XTP/dITP diphosphohydrolase
VGSTDAENTAKLIDALSGVAERAAEFRSVIAVAYPDGTSLCVEGALPGVIIDTPRGENGFGYDPVFVPLSDPQRTLAEHSLEEKNQMSHRAIALRALGAALRNA